MVFSGLTGVAWASDGAVPGDWNYGIDQAMEAIGIGNGGAEERLQELAEIRDGEPPGLVVASTKTPLRADSGSVVSPPVVKQPDAGLALAAESVVQQGSDKSLVVRNRVSPLLIYLLRSGEIDSAIFVEIARNLADQHRPLGGLPADDTGRPDGAGAPDNTGRSDDTGRPDNTGKP